MHLSVQGVGPSSQTSLHQVIGVGPDLPGSLENTQMADGGIGLKVQQAARGQEM